MDGLSFKKAARMELDQDACYRAIEMRDARFDGRIFTAVSSTGIYCRPVCPARTPMRKNVTFYASAAAAQEAGYRPCLRCRPETAPDLGAWRGTSNTVSRALRLIDMGALDDGDLEGLAGRLGVGGRHLRRLFKQHLGASPVSVAQTRRVLLAKQLIHDTRLPMAEIALASGFGSVRRFNETFLQLYGRPPRELRRETGEDVLHDGGEIIVRLRCKSPYDWGSMLAFFAQRAIGGLETVENGVYSRVISVDGVVGRVALSIGEADEIHARISIPDLTVLPVVIARLRRVFDLGVDPDAINAVLGEDATLAPLIAARPGLRSPGAWDVFEMAVRAVLGQQITVGGAATLGARLCTRLGEPSDLGDGLSHAFPTSEAVSTADLTDLGLPRRRAETLNRLAAAFIADPALLSPQQSLEEAVKALCAISGVGPWTAQYVALRALREPDAFPASDVALLNAWERATGVRLSAQELEIQAEAWRPWRGYAAQHLWASL